MYKMPGDPSTKQSVVILLYLSRPCALIWYWLHACKQLPGNLYICPADGWLVPDLGPRTHRVVMQEPHQFWPGQGGNCWWARVISSTGPSGSLYHGSRGSKHYPYVNIPDASSVKQLHHCLTFQGDENSYYNTDELSNTDILRSALDTVRTTEQLLSY